MAASKLTENVTHEILALLAGAPEVGNLEKALRLMCKWRAQLLLNTLKAKEDHARVLSGPFKGMEYNVASTEGSGVARLIGCYEVSLNPIIEDIIARSYPNVIDIGCAEGYYAVGLALRMPDAVIRAYDTNEKAQLACAQLAKQNGVAERISIGGTFEHSDFDLCLRQPTLVLCDIEGAEEALLDPLKSPSLKAADILVEVHDCFNDGLSEEIAARFKTSHSVAKINRDVDMSALPDWMETLSDMDRLMALWEWRIGPTTWLWMQARDRIL